MKMVDILYLTEGIIWKSAEGRILNVFWSAQNSLAKENCSRFYLWVARNKVANGSLLSEGRWLTHYCNRNAFNQLNEKVNKRRTAFITGGEKNKQEEQMQTIRTFRARDEVERALLIRVDFLYCLDGIPCKVKGKQSQPPGLLERTLFAFRWTWRPKTKK